MQGKSLEGRWGLSLRSCYFSLLSVTLLWLLFAQAYVVGLPRRLSGRESACGAGDPSLTPGLVRSPGEGNGDQLQCSCLGNPTDRGARQAAVHGVLRVRPHRLQDRKRCFQLLQDEISYPRISRCHLTTPGPTFMNKEIHCYRQFTLDHQALLALQIQERH